MFKNNMTSWKRCHFRFFNIAQICFSPSTRGNPFTLTMEAESQENNRYLQYFCSRGFRTASIFGYITVELFLLQTWLHQQHHQLHELVLVGIHHSISEDDSFLDVRSENLTIFFSNEKSMISTENEYLDTVLRKLFWSFSLKI